jgi:hypothetical protein
MKIRAATMHDARGLTALTRALAAEHPGHWRWRPGLSWRVHVAVFGDAIIGWVATMSARIGRMCSVCL